MSKEQNRQDIKLANQAWEVVMIAHARLLRTFAADGVFTGLSMREYDVLYTLTKANKALTSTEIAQAVALSQPALSRMIERMIERGLLNREKNLADRRSSLISLTSSGRNIQQQIGRLHARSVTRELFARLTPAEMQTLQQIAGKLALKESQPVSCAANNSEPASKSSATNHKHTAKDLISANTESATITGGV